MSRRHQNKESAQMAQSTTRTMAVGTLLAAALACASAVLSGCCGGGHGAQPPPVRYGFAEVRAALPDGTRTGVERIVLATKGPQGGERDVLEWFGGSSLKLPVGRTQFELIAVDSSNLPVWHASRGVEIAEGETVELSFTDWQRAEFTSSRDLGLATALGAVVLAVLLGSAWRFSLARVVWQHPFLLVPTAVVVGFVLAAVGVGTWLGVAWVSACGHPSIWLAVLGMGAGSLVLLGFRFHVLTVPFVDCVLTGALIGAAASFACLSWPVVAATGLPWLPLLTLSAWASVGVCIAIHETAR
jgi:hypothetical protein